MDSYFEIKAIPDPELMQSAVLAQLMQVLHGLLPAYQGSVGLSFPGYGQARTLGGILRLHGSSSDLAQLSHQVHNDATVGSYALVTEVMSVPEKPKGYAVFQRLHVRGSSHFRRLEKRHRARGTWTPELEQGMAEKYQQATICPHVALKSHSTGQARFLLFIERKSRAEPAAGRFNAYGLSRLEEAVTVPLF